MSSNKLVIRDLNNVVIKTINESDLAFVPRVGDIIKLLIGNNNLSFKVIKVVLSVPYNGFTDIVVAL